MKQATLKRRLIISLIIFAILLVFYIVKAATAPSGLASNFFAIALLCVGVAVISAFLTNGRDKYRKLYERLERDCDPEAFMMEAGTLLKQEADRKHSRGRFTFILYIAEGMYAAGKYQEAVDTLISAEPSTQEKDGKANAARWYHLLCLACLELGKLDTAKKALAGMKQALGALKPGKAASLYERRYNEDTHILGLAEGNAEGAEQTFREMFLTAQSNYERVFAAFMRGKVCRQLGRDDEAAEYFGYVVHSGGKLYITKQAVEYLRQKD